jgi:rubrerythrin
MNKPMKDLKQKIYQCRYCGRTHGTYTGDRPMGQCPARKKPKFGIAPHSWMRIK